MQILQSSRPRAVFFSIVAMVLVACSARAGTSREIWPAAISANGSTLWLSSPSFESWDYLRVRIAASVQHKHGESETLAGKVVIEAQTFADRARQQLSLRGFRVLSLELSGADAAEITRRRDTIDRLLRDLHSTTDLNEFVASLAGSKPLPSIDVATDVPKIFVSKTPAVVLQFDGPPMWLPIEGSKISYAVNTNWDIFYDNKSTFYYLLAGDIWLATHDPFSNEWVMPKSLPKELKSIPRTPDFANVWKHLPYSANPDLHAPKVYYTENAAELILIDGEPRLEPVVGSISAVVNTQSDVFFHEPTKTYYFLVAGRWFETADLTGYWRRVSKIPPEFASIPGDHPKSHVLAHVPGTPHSLREALWALVPQLATVQRSGTKAIVEFAGKPKFQPIDGTDLLWVPNATVPVIARGKDFYACQHAVWFHASDPDGPWAVASSLPADIYRIPARSPVFNLSFVRLVSSDENSVTFGYTGGYENLFVHEDLVVYGTGFPHPPALQYGAYTYPIYYAQPSTYGVGAWYDPDRHVFLRGRPGYGPFGGFGATCRFNSVTSHYFRAQTLYGDNLGEGPTLAFLPYTGAYGKLTTVYEPYAKWDPAVVKRGSRDGTVAVEKRNAPVVKIQVGTPSVGAPDADVPSPETSFHPKEKR